MFLDIKKLLDSSINRAKIRPELEAVRVMNLFQELAKSCWGEVISSEMKALYIKNGCLTVAVLNNIYAQEIRLKEADFVREINTKMGKIIVVKIRCLI